jgi:hypothetical protein
MRSRDMMTKLDRLPTRKEEVKVWDLSLLSPAEQDRAHELLSLIGGAEDVDLESLEPTLTEFRTLVEGLPMLGEHDPEQGPSIEVPDGLRSYWTWSQKASEWRHYSFSNLGKVQTLRFVELCREYGYSGGEDDSAKNDAFGRQLRDQMTPLAEWDAADRAEMAALLDVAAAPTDNVRIA